MFSLVRPTNSRHCLRGILFLMASRCSGGMSDQLIRLTGAPCSRSARSLRTWYTETPRLAASLRRDSLAVPGDPWYTDIRVFAQTSLLSEPPLGSPGEVFFLLLDIQEERCSEITVWHRFISYRMPSIIIHVIVGALQSLFNEDRLVYSELLNEPNHLCCNST
jgi:hypothetical protein